MTGMTEKDSDSNVLPRRKIHLFGRTIPLPQMVSRLVKLEAKVNCHLESMGFRL